MDDDQRRFWHERTGPFARTDGSRPAVVRLRQVSDNAFGLEEAFVMRLEGRSEVAADVGFLRATNLASIPGYLGWFMRRHGRHTPAALIHDQLVREGASDVHVPFGERAAADLLFREMLEASGVPLARRWLMWTAVTIATRSGTWWRRGLLAVWFLAAAAGIGFLSWALWERHVGWQLLALLFPAVAGVLWGRQWRAGVIAGYALPFALIGSIPGIVSYHVYWAVEQVVGVITGDRPPDFTQR